MTFYLENPDSLDGNDLCCVDVLRVLFEHDRKSTSRIVMEIRNTALKIIITMLQLALKIGNKTFSQQLLNEPRGSLC